MSRFIEIRLGIRRAVKKIAAMPGMQGFRDRIIDIFNLPWVVRDAHDALSDAVDNDAEGSAAINAEGSAPIEDRPFLDWLINQGGWKIIYGIVRAILAMFGIVLPPLPTLGPAVLGVLSEIPTLPESRV
jgi:hypothetical protein